MFTPKFIHTINITKNGARHKAVNAVDTTVGGRFSGSLNTWVISGLGLFPVFREGDD